jgi:hypothetical protein
LGAYTHSTPSFRNNRYTHILTDLASRQYYPMYTKDRSAPELSARIGAFFDLTPQWNHNTPGVDRFIHMNVNWFLVDFSGNYFGSWKLIAFTTSFPSSNRSLYGKFCSTKLSKKSFSSSTLVPTLNPLDFLALRMTPLEKDAGGAHS